MSEYDDLTWLLSHHREAAPLACITPPPKNALVIGAYKGDTINLLHSMYSHCNIIGFEPQLWAFERCQQRFASNERVTVLPYGLGADNSVRTMYEFGNDACSFVEIPGARTFGKGTVKPADVAFTVLGLTDVDVAVINIEGGEYELLPYLGKRDLLRHIANLIIQWHYIPEYTGPLLHISKLLHASHSMFWRYDSWEWWTALP